MIKKIMYSIAAFTLSFLLFDGSAFAEKPDKDVDWNGKVVEKLKINKDLTLEKLEDGRVLPVSKDIAESLNEIELIDVTTFMGYENTESISTGLKRQMAQDGGKAVVLKDKKIKFKKMDKDGNVIEKGESPLNNHSMNLTTSNTKTLKNYHSIMAASIPPSIDNDEWSGAIYAGLSGTTDKQFKYALYFDYDWKENPFAWVDKMGLAWTTGGTKVAGSDYSNHYLRLSTGRRTDLIDIEESTSYGTVINVEMANAHDGNQWGYQTVKVYYDEEDGGKEEFFAGKYVHNWQIVANDISIGPATIDISDGFYEWDLEANFELGK
ncbi:hypothetical protein V1503_19755 [Bacillus sp. SCS-151]|uniref:hypothetical protein n=1 Tax=Nanhaiella sioensis TaxID=3115293 RepID=UPI00397CFBB3